jgi:hypothetical protein
MQRARQSFHAALLLLAFLPFLPLTAGAQVYSHEDLQAEAVRLRNAVLRIYSIGIVPSLTDEELRAAGEFEFSFPLPEPNDPLMDFSATTDGRTMIMPLMSLKALEDLATAYAWLYHNGYSLSTIDLYFTMLRHRNPADFPGGRFPKILEALGVPPDAYKTDKRVDELSLSLRNEAYAFIIAHELGHIRYAHKPLNQISAQQAQADEIQSDAFALDILLRTKTPPLGPVLFFQAQVYNLLHQADLGATEQERSSALLQMTHPMTTERIRKMSDFIEGPLTRARPDEAALWSDMAAKLRAIIPVMEDEDLAACLVKVAKEAHPDILKPRRGIEADAMLASCGGN